MQCRSLGEQLQDHVGRRRLHAHQPISTPLPGDLLMISTAPALPGSPRARLRERTVAEMNTEPVPSEVPGEWDSQMKTKYFNTRPHRGNAGLMTAKHQLAQLTGAKVVSGGLLEGADACF